MCVYTWSSTPGIYTHTHSPRYTGAGFYLEGWFGSEFKQLLNASRGICCSLAGFLMMSLLELVVCIDSWKTTSLYLCERTIKNVLPVAVDLVIRNTNSDQGEPDEDPFKIEILTLSVFSLG